MAKTYTGRYGEIEKGKVPPPPPPPPRPPIPIRLMTLGATGAIPIRLGRELYLCLYIKNRGAVPGTVRLSAYFLDPNGQRYSPDVGASGYSETIDPGRTPFYCFSVTPSIKGRWTCQISISGDLTKDVTYRIPVL